jgi:amidohydrolase
MRNNLFLLVPTSSDQSCRCLLNYLPAAYHSHPHTTYPKGVEKGGVMELKPDQHNILAAIDLSSEKILAASHQIHAHPELGYQEVFASGLLAETLEAFDYQVERGFAGIPTAFRARKGGGQGPRVAFLAEYDALPEVGHACGHNLIAAAALAAGIGLGAVIAEIQGEVWVVGTPAEETDGAKVVMVERGAFKDVDAAIMVHALDGNYTLAETLAMDALEVEFFGKPSHAAVAPWEGLNALDALILTFNNINALRQQVRPDARIHGVITDGGAAPNIIPQHSAARFYLRARQRSYLNEMNEKFKACVQASALATGTRFEMRNYENSFDDMLNNETLANRMRDYFTQALGSKPFQRSPDQFGSGDMGNVSHVVPAVHVLVDVADGKAISPHTAEFQAAVVTPYADAAILRAGKAMALAGYDVIADPNFLEAIRLEFIAGLGNAPGKK